MVHPLGVMGHFVSVQACIGIRGISVLGFLFGRLLGFGPLLIIDGYLCRTTGVAGLAQSPVRFALSAVPLLRYCNLNLLIPWVRSGVLVGLLCCILLDRACTPFGVGVGTDRVRRGAERVGNVPLRARARKDTGQKLAPPSQPTPRNLRRPAPSSSTHLEG